MHAVYFSIQIIGLALVFIQVMILYRRISMKHQALILLYTVFVGISAYGYLIELDAKTQQVALTGVKIAYLGKVYLLYTMMLVMGHLTRVKFPKWLKAVMFFIATATLIMVGTCEHHTLYYSSIGFTYEGQFPHLLLGHGPVYYLYSAYLFLCLLAGVGMCTYGYCKTADTIRRKQIPYFLAVIVMQMVGFTAFLTGVTRGYDITALFNCVSVIFLMRITIRYNLVDTLSVAKDQVLDEIGTGVVILGENDQLLYANRIAKDIYPQLMTNEAYEAVADVVHYAGAGKYKFYKNKVYTISGQEVHHSALPHGQVFVLNDVTVSYYYAQTLVEEVDEKTTEVRRMQEEMEQFYFQVINALSSAVEAKDRYTKGHSMRVADYAREIARRMGMSEEEQREIYYAGLLHDVGKIRVPDFIINKDGKLTADEYENIKLHTVSGYYILKNVSNTFDVASVARWHHERYDGKGYPDGLTGENIPLAARIVCVADSYDAMTSNRSYRSALPQNAVRSEILAGMGKQFDPRIADIMIQMIDEDQEYQLRQFRSEQKNILLVDDNDEDLNTAEEIIATQSHYVVHKAKTVEACKHILLEQDIDLVLVDMDATGMDGYRVIKAIQDYGNTPIIFATSEKEIDIVKKAAELGTKDYLIKPYLSQTLLEIIHNVLQPSVDF
ncbi:MAG: HD domain-containing protein [Lachnospiraceae bacterium]|nr:HD domain-containing protein [Lachnospiraceae bacterium]